MIERIISDVSVLRGLRLPTKDTILGIGRGEAGNCQTANKHWRTNAPTSPGKLILRIKPMRRSRLFHSRSMHTLASTTRIFHDAILLYYERSSSRIRPNCRPNSKPDFIYQNTAWHDAPRCLPPPPPPPQQHLSSSHAPSHHMRRAHGHVQPIGAGVGASACGPAPAAAPCAPVLPDRRRSSPSHPPHLLIPPPRPRRRHRSRRHPPGRGCGPLLSGLDRPGPAGWERGGCRGPRPGGQAGPHPRDLPGLRRLP